MEELILLNHISKYYTIGRKKKLIALNDVSLQINKGETLGIVGESGSGKSTLARIVMGIEKPDCGQVFYAGEPIRSPSPARRLSPAGKAQIIFQNSSASLNPKMTIESIVTEGMEIHKMFDKAGRRQRAVELLAMVGLEKAHLKRYPHEFSGGQRQRICIARALSINPEFLVCDEPISALDISVQCHIMNLLKTFKEDFGLTYLFIAHDLNMVHYISDRIAVIYSGRIVELGESQTVCLHPCHPYTKFLLDSVLIPDPDRKSLDNIRIPICETAPDHDEAGCAFVAFCPRALEICRIENPVLKETEIGHFSACHLS